jgi:phosphate transport system substrate-binding protein
MVTWSNFGNAFADDNVIVAKGAHTLANPVHHLGESFKTEFRDFTIVASGGGSGVGIRALLNSEADLALAVRELSEEEKALAAEKGLSIQTRIVGRDGVAIVTSPKQVVSELTLDQIRKIFTGELTSWKDIGGSEKPIQVVIADPKRHGTPGFFRKAVLEGKPYRRDCRIERNWAPLLRRIAAADDAVGFCITQKAIESADKVKLIAVKSDAQSQGVEFSWDTIENGSYPIRRPVFFYWDNNNKKKALKEFLKYSEEKGIDLKRN